MWQNSIKLLTLPMTRKRSITLSYSAEHLSRFISQKKPRKQLLKQHFS